MILKKIRTISDVVGNVLMLMLLTLIMSLLELLLLLKFHRVL